MKIDQIAFDALKDKYQVIEIASQYESPYEGEVVMRLAHDGFERLIQDLRISDKQVIDDWDIFAVSPIEIRTDKRYVYLAKFPLEKYPMNVIVESGKKLLEVFSAKGCTGIVLPDVLDISILTVEQLTQMRDNLTEVIQNMNYDNIIGF